MADELQGRGIGTRLLEQLAAIAGSHGVERFVAVVLPENARMLRVFMDAGFDVARTLEQGIFELEFPITPTEAYRAHVDERDHTAVVASPRSLLRARERGCAGRVAASPARSAASSFATSWRADSPAGPIP